MVQYLVGAVEYMGETIKALPILKMCDLAVILWDVNVNGSDLYIRYFQIRSQFKGITLMKINVFWSAFLLQ